MHSVHRSTPPLISTTVIIVIKILNNFFSLTFHLWKYPKLETFPKPCYLLFSVIYSNDVIIHANLFSDAFKSVWEFQIYWLFYKINPICLFHGLRDYVIT